jgi:ComF family protein
VWFKQLLTPGQRPLLPSLCALCHSWGEHRICADCTRRWAPAVNRCARCAIEVPAATPVCGACLIDPPPYTRSVVAFDYAPPWSGVIARFKFNSALDLVPALARQLLDAIRASVSPLPDLLLPVPLSEKRLRERGFNQAWEIARALSAELGCKSDPRLLLRTADTPHQLALPPNARAANVRGVFAVEPLRRAELRGKALALIDDVVTTGATSAEIANTLLQAGAANVQVWALARTPAPDR